MTAQKVACRIDQPGGHEMSDLGDYLASHYLEHAQFVTLCATPADELDRLLERALVPQPAYVVTADRVLMSAAFGCLGAVDEPAGRFFHPGCATWVSIARRIECRVGTRLASGELKRQFLDNFVTAYRECCDEMRSPGLDAPAESAWPDFVQGVFGVCVANPSSERSIARKEALQEILGRLTANGTRANFASSEAPGIRALVDDYSQCIMPFSPLEYARSSRRRLVDELRQKLAPAL
jgi:Family of unknown function (DUF6058)